MSLATLRASLFLNSLTGKGVKDITSNKIR